jgi:excinuclease ABC subunit C
MKEAAGALKYEEAAGFRNAIRAIESLSENNTVADMDPENRDYIAWAAEGIFTTFSVLSMRSGKMTGRELFSSRSAADENESLETFIAAYYTPDRPPPSRIYLAVAVSGPIDAYFSEQFGFVPELLSPTRPGAVPWDNEKRHVAALSMARQNAQEELRRRLRERGAGPALDELARILGLKTRPERIEGFDIAQLDGRHPVASLISFKNGVPDRKNYRYFKLRTVVGIVDDFASVREAVHRRYSRLIREGKELPDLILIDGGIGQVNAARGVLDELGIPCDVAGLAKRDEEIWRPHNAEPVRLSRNSEALKVLQFVRDETHRFATGLNQRLRSKDLYFPVLESIEGIGPKRAAAIMKIYGGLENIASAEPEDIAEKCGGGGTAARAVRAAARLALEDRAATKKKFAAQSKEEVARGRQKLRPRNAVAALAGEASAAEDAPEYGKKPVSDK